MRNEVLIIDREDRLGRGCYNELGGHDMRPEMEVALPRGEEIRSGGLG